MMGEPVKKGEWAALQEPRRLFGASELFEELLAKYVAAIKLAQNKWSANRIGTTEANTSEGTMFMPHTRDFTLDDSVDEDEEDIAAPDDQILHRDSLETYGRSKDGRARIAVAVNAERNIFLNFKEYQEK